VIWQHLATPYWEGVLKGLVAEHVRETQSRHADQLLAGWSHERARFWQVVPKEMLTRLPEPLTLAPERAEAGDD
jgi:glutamate synthase (NADPH) large chain